MARADRVLEAKDFDKVVADIAQMTDDNDHNGARIEAAKLLKMKQYVKVFTAIDDIRNALNNMPSDVGKFRNAMTSEMLKFAKSKLSKEDFQKLNNAF